MTEDAPFRLDDFLPYLLNRAAERASLGFQARYKARYGMLRTEWRVVAHLGRFGTLTAREICDRAGLHKTKVSRAVAALERKRFVRRAPVAGDRRSEALSLTAPGLEAYRDLAREAAHYEADLTRALSSEEERILRDCLRRLASGSGD